MVMHLHFYRAPNISFHQHFLLPPKPRAKRMAVSGHVIDRLETHCCLGTLMESLLLDVETLKRVLNMNEVHWRHLVDVYGTSRRRGGLAL